MYNAISVETVNYTYDSLNRMIAAAGSGWSESYAYDGFGNLTAKAGTPANVQFAVTTATNQLGTPDPNGNTTSIVANGNQTINLNYDAENRLAQAGWQSNGNIFVDYAYDGQNRRIFSWTGFTEDSNNNMKNYLVSIYSPGGQKLATYQLAPGIYGPSTPYLQVSLFSSDEYFGSRRLAVLDQLGSAGTYYPWGEAKGSTNPQDTWSYATYWRD